MDIVLTLTFSSQVKQSNLVFLRYCWTMCKSFAALRADNLGWSAYLGLVWFFFCTYLSFRPDFTETNPKNDNKDFSSKCPKLYISEELLLALHSWGNVWNIWLPLKHTNQPHFEVNFFSFRCFSLSIEYYDSLKEWLSNPYSSI